MVVDGITCHVDKFVDTVCQTEGTDTLKRGIILVLFPHVSSPKYNTESTLNNTVVPYIIIYFI